MKPRGNGRGWPETQLTFICNQAAGLSGWLMFRPIWPEGHSGWKKTKEKSATKTQ